MAFEFLGTFTGSQFTRFAAFARAQVAQIDDRINHAQAELNRIGAVAFSFDSGGVPLGMATPDDSTYAGRLFQVYEALGGDAFYDLQVRSASQPVFKLRGDETRSPQQMSNGEVMSTPGLSDQQSGEAMRQSRDWIWDNLFYRRDLLERKIRRLMDYADQLQTEINQLQAMKAAASVQGSLEFLLGGVTQLVSDRNYLAASNDSSQPDPHGKLAYAPFASYMPGPDRSDVESFERTLDGPAVPQGDGSQ